MDVGQISLTNNFGVKSVTLVLLLENDFTKILKDPKIPEENRHSECHD